MPEQGRRIVVASWAGVALFTGVAAAGALAGGVAAAVSVITALALFFVGIGVWVAAFAIGLARSAAGENVAVANLFLLQGSASREARLHLFGALAVSIVAAAATAKATPTSVLVPLLPFGLCGLWAARHGTFPARQVQDSRARARPRSTAARATVSERRARGGHGK